MSGMVFIRPRLIGPRFEDGEMPLEFLGDLAALREMVIDVARWRFFQKNPGRARAPKGLESVSFNLAGVEKGSATPLITVSHPVGQPAREWLLYMENARDSILDVIASGGVNGEDSLALETWHLAHFNRLGGSLRDGEAMEFGAPGRLSARLTQETRGLLLSKATVKETFEKGAEQALELRGFVPEVDQHDGTFELHLLDGGKMVVPFQKQHFDTVINAFMGYREDLQVNVRGIGKHGRGNRLVGLESVDEISLFDPLDVSARLAEFKDMKDGWFEGEGIAPSLDGLDWLASAFERRYASDVPSPYLYPMPEGGIRAEWSFGANAIVLEIDLSEHTAEWLWFDRDSDANEERRLNLDDDGEWAWLANEVRSKAGVK